MADSRELASRPPRQINRQRFGILIAVTLLAGGAVYGVHGYQVRRNASTLLEQARRAEKEDRPENAVHYYRQYLLHRPNDVDALASLGLLLERGANTPAGQFDVFLTLNQVLRQDPNRDDVRRSVIKLAVGMARHGDALDHLEFLKERQPDDSELSYWEGVCYQAKGNGAKASESFANSIRQDPARTDSYMRQAIVLRQHLKQPEAADQTIRDMVARNPEALAARLAAARYFGQVRLMSEAATHVAAALKMAPEDSETLRAASSLELQMARSGASSWVGGSLLRQKRAKEYLELAMEKQPGELQTYLDLSNLELARGDRDAAVAALRRGLKANEGQPTLLWNLADLLVVSKDASEAKEAAEIISRLKNVEGPAALTEYLVAKRDLAEERWNEAASRLERLRPLLRGHKDVARQAEFCLGEAYRELRRPQQQEAAFRRALQIDPTWMPARLGLAGALLSSGRHDDALIEYRRLMSLPGVPLTVARLLVMRQLRRAPAERDWREVEGALKVAGNQPNLQLDVALLRSDVLVAQDKPADARRQIEQTIERWPHAIKPTLALATMLRNEGDNAAARQVLEKAKKTLPDSAKLRLAIAQATVLEEGSAASDRLETLAKDLAAFDREDRLLLLAGLGGLHAGIQDHATARKRYREAAELEPNQLNNWFVLLNLGLESGDDEQVGECLDAINRIEGPGGAFGMYGAAVRLAMQAKKDGAKGVLSSAHELLGKLSAERPEWAAVARLEAYIAELEGNHDLAIEKYTQSIEQGDHDIKSVRRAVELLYQRGRFSEADELLRRFEEEGFCDIRCGALQRVAAKLSLQRGDPQRSLQLATAAVPADSTDYREQLWLGKMLATLGNGKKAEEALRRATELAPKEPGPWIALVRFLAKANRTDDAAGVLKQASGNLGHVHRHLVLAQGSEAIRQRAEARKWYAKALEQSPRDVGVLWSVANFNLYEPDPAKAESSLRAILDPAVNAPRAEAAWARRHLAHLLGRSRDFRKSNEALRLLDVNAKEYGETVPDRRVRATVLSLRPGIEDKKLAIKQWEEIDEREPLQPGAELELAKLLEATNNWQRAKQRLLSLLSADSKNTEALRVYAQALLRRDLADEAEPWIEKLAAADPHGLPTIELKARWLAMRGRTEEALAVLSQLDDSASKSGDAPRKLGAGAIMMDTLAQSMEQAGKADATGQIAEAAEQMYRRYAAARPEHAIALAAYLGRRGETTEAFQILEKALDSTPEPMAAATAVAIAIAGKPTAEQSKRVETLLESALKRQPNSPALLLHLATLRGKQQRFEEAVGIYRRTVAIDPDNVAARNNLAWLLAQGLGSPKEASDHIEHALLVVGPAPELLDTRGAVHLASGRPRDAIADLNRAIAAAPTAARRLHLAQAQLEIKDLTNARRSLEEAKAMGLAMDRLHPLERAAATKVIAALGVNLARLEVTPHEE